MILFIAYSYLIQIIFTFRILRFQRFPKAWRRVPKADCIILLFGFVPSHLAYMLGGKRMTSIDSHCPRPLDLVNQWQARSSGFVPGDLAKACIVHITPGDPLTSIERQRYESPPLLKSPFCVKSCLVGGTDPYPRDLEKSLKELEIGRKIETLQPTA